MDALFDFDAVAHDIPIQKTVQPPEEVVSKVHKASFEGEAAVLEQAIAQIQASCGDRYIDYLARCLYLAIEYRRHSIVTLLLGEGASINPSHVRAATTIGGTSTLSVLLTHGWDINAEMDWGEPPLLALAAENEDVTNWFLSHGASPNAACHLDLTPLSADVQYAPFSVIKLLFDRGGSVSSGQLLHYAVRRELTDYLDVLVFLLDKRPSINGVMCEGLYCYYQQRAFGLGTALHEASEKGKLDVVELMVAHGAHPLIKDPRGRTAQDWADRAGHYSIAKFLKATAATASPLWYQFTDGRHPTGFG
ncbi:hypothetical protein LTR37_019585 [Vermiconidia calcicola]|uniref:Uncharacterized protein n=1 Tax=Vermiconidia calcicola TaxID=1690605 RepID=A0ACC3MGR1_9PEZI|nr:hypothetical protein LTR37_019585 [Vermiconidia calcicola]